MTENTEFSNFPDFQDVHDFEAWTPLPFPEQWATLDREERETLINMSYISPIGTVYTNEPRMITKMRRLCEAHPENYKVSRVFTRNGKATAVEVAFVRTLISFRSFVRHIEGGTHFKKKADQ